MFGAFADAHLMTLDEPELDRFEALLSVPDWQMFDWVMGQSRCPRRTRPCGLCAALRLPKKSRLLTHG